MWIKSQYSTSIQSSTRSPAHLWPALSYKGFSVLKCACAQLSFINSPFHSIEESSTVPPVTSLLLNQATHPRSSSCRLCVPSIIQLHSSEYIKNCWNVKFKKDFWCLVIDICVSFLYSLFFLPKIDYSVIPNHSVPPSNDKRYKVVFQIPY